jgi:PucR C-terminal helix-turn-helix domain/GGDEF-like domain
VEGSPEQARAAVAERLRAGRTEIEQAISTRVYAISEPVESADPEYAHGLRLAVGAALGYGLDALGRSEDRAPPIPAVLLAQSRLAARAGISLDTVVRRYLAGYTVLSDFVVREAEAGGLLSGGALHQLLRTQAVLLDRLLDAVSEEHSRELDGRLSSLEQRRADQVKRLLAGELIDTSNLGYEFGGSHLGVLAGGPGIEDSLRALAAAHDRRLLLVRRDEGSAWAWLGARRGFTSAEIDEFVGRDWPPGVSVAFGEPAQGLAGWRLTHRQARMALPVALRGCTRVVRYSSVALLASMLRDDVLVTSFRRLYLEPLSDGRDGGAVLRKTLRAYFDQERNVSSAAAALGVSRQTVKRRLYVIEERLAAPLSACAMEVEAALRVDDLDDRFAPEATSA